MKRTVEEKAAIVELTQALQRFIDVVGETKDEAFAIRAEQMVLNVAEYVNIEFTLETGKDDIHKLIQEYHAGS